MERNKKELPDGYVSRGKFYFPRGKPAAEIAANAATVVYLWLADEQERTFIVPRATTESRIDPPVRRNRGNHSQTDLRRNDARRVS